MAGIHEPDPAVLRESLQRGAIGLEIAADVLAAPDGLERLEPLLDVLEAARAPLLVHPGPAGLQDAPGRPAWWGPVVPYVAQLHAAWWAWTNGGRDRFPQLPVCFAALAGLGPLHGERQRARGGGRGSIDPLTFVETSSYGTQAVDAVIRVLGIDVVCHGSDRPYAVPVAACPWRRRAARDPYPQPRAAARTQLRGGARMMPLASPAIDGLDLPDRQLERLELVRPRRERRRAPASCGCRTSTSSATGRSYAALHRDASIDLWAIFWLPENDTGWHDHDTSSGAVRVSRGRA